MFVVVKRVPKTVGMMNKQSWVPLAADHGTRWSRADGHQKRASRTASNKDVVLAAVAKEDFPQSPFLLSLYLLLTTA